MSLTNKPAGQISPPNAVNPEAPEGIDTPNTLASEAAGSVSTPNTLTSESAGSVSTPNTINPESAGSVSTPNTLTAETAGAVVAPNEITGVTVGKIDPPYAPVTLDLDFAKNIYSELGADNVFSDIITFSRSTTSTYFGREVDQFGNVTFPLKTAAINEPCLAYDPATGESLGLQVFGSATNLLAYSEEFDNAAWNKISGATINQNSDLAPDGTMSADTLIFDASASSRVEQGVAVSIGQEYTFSCWIKSATMTEVLFEVGIGGDINSVSITNQWQRYSVTNTATGVNVFPQIQNNDATAGEIQVWGAQLETGTIPTPYIKTEASQVTRAADLASVNDLSGWYNQTQGSVFVDFNGIQDFSIITQLDNGTDVNRLAIQTEAVTGFNVYQKRISSVIQSLTATNGSGKAAISINEINSEMSSNGLFYQSQSAGLPSGVNSLKLGNENSSNNALSGHIKRLTYYPAALSAQKLQDLTR